MNDQERGLYQKYEVRRLNDLEGKHAGCYFFVLDIRHDIHACAALRAYIESCREEYPVLATDLEAILRAQVFERVNDRFLQKLAAEEPGHPWVAAMEETAELRAHLRTMARNHREAVQREMEAMGRAERAETMIAELRRLLQDHHNWIDAAMRALQPRQEGWMSPPTFETAKQFLAARVAGVAEGNAK